MNQNARFYAFLILLFTVVSSVGILYSLQISDSSLTKKEIILGKTTAQPSLVKNELPLRISIPKINVDAAIQEVGLTAQGAMDVPSNATDTGWYKYGSIPGERGSAVIAGHYDGENGTKGVFEKLHLLKSGDKIYIKDSTGKTKSFIVRESRMYNPEEDASTVFNQSDGTHLNLITCYGLWDSTQNSYSKRLVVFTDVTP